MLNLASSPRPLRLVPSLLLLLGASSLLAGACSAEKASDDNTGGTTGVLPGAAGMSGGGAETGGAGGGAGAGGTLAMGGTAGAVALAGAGGAAGSGGAAGAGGQVDPALYCQTAARQMLPFDAFTRFYPDGYMGDNTEIVAVLTPDCNGIASDAGATPMDAGSEITVTQCLAFDHLPVAGGMGWAGVAFQHPNGNWGLVPGLCVADGATKIVFHARVESGTPTLKFGGAGAGEITVTLGPVWQRFEVPLTGVPYNQSGDSGGIALGFTWVRAEDTNPDLSPMRLFVGDVTFE